MTLLRIASYSLAGYLGAAVAFVLPFDSAPYQVVSAGAQVLCVLLGLDY